MSVAEMKKSIIEKVETFSEQQLLEVTRFVDSLNSTAPKEYDLLSHIDSIVAEREEVLKKLAQ